MINNNSNAEQKNGLNGLINHVSVNSCNETSSSIDPHTYWRQQSQLIDWIKPFTRVSDVSFKKDDFRIKWFEDGQLNLTANCVDRHAAATPDKVAIIWEGDDPSESRSITYAELLRDVTRFANALKTLNVTRGDRVTIYMPMIPEAAVAMLACARIGAIHSVVFGGFSPEALADRISDCVSKVVITADESVRGGKFFPLKSNLDKALENPVTASVQNVVVVRRTGRDIGWKEARDHWFHNIIAVERAECEPAVMDAEDPLFILYTSGSTGKPKGVLHTTAGYLVYVASTYNHIFDIKPNDVFWCTADIGWVTGHSYVLYAPLALGVTTVMYEGVPQYPNWSRIGQIIDKHNVSIFYTAPTAIRALMREGATPLTASSRDSLRLLGTVGEPINPEAWHWYHDTFGEGKHRIVDTWWQTETGATLISPTAHTVNAKPGAAMQPLPTIATAVVDNDGHILEGATEGSLVLLDSWPGQARSIYGDHKRFIETYFSTFEGMYFTGDGVRRDDDGDYWITGRVDDVLNVSGHRLGTAEVESALVAHPLVAEAAVVGIPHDIKGQGIYAYVTLKSGALITDTLQAELKDTVRREIGAIATPEYIQWAIGLPKTRSGKIMRRILRKIAANELDGLGDTSTLADPSVVDNLIQGRLQSLS